MLLQLTGFKGTSLHSYNILQHQEQVGRFAKGWEKKIGPISVSDL